MENDGWIDITVALENEMVFWPGDIPVKVFKTATFDMDQVNVTGLQFSAHTATHIDAPLHYLNNGKDVAQLPLNKLIGTTTIVLITDQKEISVNTIKDMHLQKGDNIFFKTRHSKSNWARLAFQKDYVYLSKDAAVFLAEKQINCVGIDYLSIAQFNNGAEVHRILLENNIIIIEGLSLANAEPGIYDMVCLPLKIKGGDGAPARVIIRKKLNH